MKRMMILVTLLMAAIVVFSGPVAGVLNLPEPTAEAKKKKKRYNVVKCPNSAYDNYGCLGTARKDRLVGGPVDRLPYYAHDSMFGGAGDDVYEGGIGCDYLSDTGVTSNDRYVLPQTEFSMWNCGTLDGPVLIEDFGGSADLLDLSSYSSSEFQRHPWGDPRGLYLDGPGSRDVHILNFFGENRSIESIKFSNRTITADEIKKEFP